MIVGVIGSGSIGPDLAYGFLSALGKVKGAKVYLVDIRKDALDAGVTRIHGYADKGVARGKLSVAAKDAMMGALVPTMELGDLKDCQYVLEAASEDLPIKRKILASLEAVVSKDCLIGFATSGLPRKYIAENAKHPERCFVNHPFYPAWRSLPIEVVSSGNAPLMAKMMSTMTLLGKVPLETADVPCFAADDIFCNYISEAARIVADGKATPAQVDRVVDDAIGGGGPFNVMDLTRGNLLTVHCQELMQEGSGVEWFAPPAILREKGNTPWHQKGAAGDSKYDDATKEHVLGRILPVLFARTVAVVDDRTCDALELNWMTRMALGFRKGVLELAEESGAAKVKVLCDAYAKRYPGFPIPKTIAGGGLPTFDKTLRVLRNGDVAVVEIFRPEVKNALSKQTLGEIDRTMTALLADGSVRGVVLTSVDGALAGADILELAALKTPNDCRDICLFAHPIFARIENAPKPIIAALDGPVMGGGAELSMACHARVVGKGFIMSQPEVNLGIIPGYGGTQRLPRLIGLERANVMLRTAQVMSAAEACQSGWAHGEPAANPRATAIELVKSCLAGKTTLTRIDPKPMAVDKLAPAPVGFRSKAIDAILTDVMRRGLAKPLAEGLALEADGFARCKQTVDMDIGMKNFMQNGPRVPAVFLHE